MIELRLEPRPTPVVYTSQKQDHTALNGSSLNKNQKQNWFLQNLLRAQEFILSELHTCYLCCSFAWSSTPTPISYSSSGRSANVTSPRRPSKTLQNRLCPVPQSCKGLPFQGVRSHLTTVVSQEGRHETCCALTRSPGPTLKCNKYFLNERIILNLKQ